MEEAEWDHFVEAFYKFLRIDRPEDDVTPDEVRACVVCIVCVRVACVC